MSKFTHNGYEFDTDKYYLFDGVIVTLEQTRFHILAKPINKLLPGTSVVDDELHTLREVTIGDPVEQKFVPRKGQAVLVSDDNSQWIICLFQEMRGDHYRTVVTVDDLKYPEASYLWKFCKPLPEEMK